MDLQKPDREARRRARVAKSLGRVVKEAAHKRAARKRDNYRCRWPHVSEVDREVCRRTPKEVAHYKSKGMGGDHGQRSRRRHLITLCQTVHQGLKGIHRGMKRVVALTPKLMDGPCAFEEKQDGRWVEVGREIHIGIVE